MTEVIQEEMKLEAKMMTGLISQLDIGKPRRKTWE